MGCLIMNQELPYIGKCGRDIQWMPQKSILGHQPHSTLQHILDNKFNRIWQNSLHKSCRYLKQLSNAGGFMQFGVVYAKLSSKYRGYIRQHPPTSPTNFYPVFDYLVHWIWLCGLHKSYRKLSHGSMADDFIPIEYVFCEIQSKYGPYIRLNF